jgi:hypothetical protein
MGQLHLLEMAKNILSASLNKGRNLTIIIRSSFQPSDMKFLQLASERMLATGDNTAIESLCSRCKLYLYETLEHKMDFLEDQKALAQMISQNLSEILNLFAMNSGDNKRPFYAPDQLARVEDLLKDPNLAEDTLKFCHQITENYSFLELFEGSMKRALWHYHLPELSGIEAQALDPDFRSYLVSLLKTSSSAEDVEGKFIEISPHGLGEKISQRIEKFVDENQRCCLAFPVRSWLQQIKSMYAKQ